MKKVLKNVFKGMISVLGIITFFSCEIGLGDAVDTEPPQFEITSPKDAAVIRGPFRIGGTWTDDGSVSKAEIELSRPDGYGLRETYSTNITKDSWYGIVDPVNEGHKLVDGTYIAKITLYDDGGHSTSKTRQFTIDNTPPVLVLQKPSSTTETPESEITSYGQIFNIQGQAADDNNVDKIVVKFYADPAFTGEPIAQVVKETVPATIDLDIAKYKDNDDLNNVYATIYGSETPKGTEDKIYFKLEAYDGAKKYSLDDGITVLEDFGNMIDSYYRYNDIATEVLAKNSIKVTDIYHMNSGFYTLSASRSASASQAEALTKSVAESLKNLKVEKGRISLNPENNPSFSISGHKSYVKGGTEEIFNNPERNVTNGSNIVMEVAVGLDAWPLNEDIWFYLLPCDATGKADETAQKMFIDATRTPAGTSYKFVAALSSANNVYKESPYGKTSAEKAALELPAKLEIGKNYVIRIWGTDQKDNGALANKSSNEEYGIHLAPSGMPPVISNVTPLASYLYVKKGDAIHFEGTVTTEEGIPEVKVTCNSKDFTAAVTQRAENTYSFVADVPKETFSQTESGQYDLKIIAKTDNSSTVQKTVSYDVNGPEISIDDVNPVASVYTDEKGTTDGKQYLNGKFNVRVSISDAYDVVDLITNRPKIQVIRKDTDEILWTEYLVTAEGKVKKETEIDTSLIDALKDAKIGSEVEIYVKITAWDRAGNESSKQNEYIVNQDTDKPVILPYVAKGLTLTLRDKAEFPNTADENSDVYGKNIYSKDSQLILRLLDDDGISNVKVYSYGVSDDNDNENKPSTPKADNNYSSNMDMTYTYNLKETAGLHRFWVDVTDINDNVTEVGPFLIKITTNAPAINVTSNPEYKPVDDKVINTIEVDSDVEPFTLWYKETKEAEWVKLGDSVSNKDSGGDVNYTVEIVNAEKIKKFVHQVEPASATTYYYIVKDANIVESNEKNVKVKVDNTKPVLSITKPANDTVNTGSSAVTTTQKFEGKITEEESQMKKIWYKVLTYTTTEPATPTAPAGNKLADATWTADNWYEVTSVGKTDWNFYQIVKDGKTDGTDNGNLVVSEGKKVMYLYGVDNAGNVSDVVSRKFDVDLNPPSIEAFTVSEGDDCVKSGETYYVSGDLKGTITASDTNGMKALSYKVGNGAEVTLTAAVPATAYDWTIPAGELTADTAVAVKIIAEDNAGKKTEKTVTVYKDTAAPAVTITAPVADSAVASEKLGIAGSAADAGSGVAKAYYQLTDSSTTLPGSWTEIAVAGSSWNVSEVSLGDEGDKYLHVMAVDKLGKIGSSTQKFNFDKAAPVLSFTNRPSSLPKTAYKLNGKVVESHGIKKTNVNGTDNTVIKVEEFVGNSETANATEYVELSQSGSDYTFSVDLPLKTTDRDTLEGNLKYVFSLKDLSDKDLTGVTSFTAERDISAPVLVVTTPGMATFGDNAVSSDKAVFRGNITEKNPNLIYYQTKKADVTAPNALTNADITSKTEAEIKALGWNLVDVSIISLNESYNGDWNFTESFDSNAATRDGNYKLYIQSADKGGNITAMQTIDFAADSAAPSITDYAVYKKTAAGVDATAVSTDASYTLKAADATGFVIKFKTSDTSGIKSVSINGTPVTADVNGYYSYGPETALGTYSYTIRAEDNSGRVKTGSETEDLPGRISELKTTVIFDNKKPEFSNVSADSSSTYSDASTWIRGTGKTYINGTTKDEGSGLKSISIKIVPNGTAASSVAYIPVALTENWSYQYAIPSTLAENTTENYHTIMVKAVDNADNETEETYYFRYDKAVPSLSLSTSGDYINGKTDSKLTLSGNVNDGASRAVKSLKLTAQLYNDTSKAYEDVKSGEAVLSTDIPTELGDYSCDVTTGVFTGVTLADGKYRFIMTATDYAGNEVSETVSAIIDTVKPQGNISIQTTTVDVDGKNWYGTEQIKVKVSGITEVTSGVDFVEAKAGTITEGDDSGLTTLSKKEKTEGGTTTVYYEGDVTVTSQGENKIYFRITDKAGNVYVSPTESTATVNIDTLAPDTLTLSSIGGKTGYDTNQPYLVNGSNAVTIVVEAADAGSTGEYSGIASVKLSNVGNTAYTDAQQISAVYASATEKWTLTIPANSAESSYIQSGDVKLTVTDNVGNKYIEKVFTFDLDADAPSVTIDRLRNDGTTSGRTDINKTVTVSGTAKDAKALLTPTGTAKPVVVKYYYAANNDGSQPDADWTETNTAIQTATLVPAAANDYSTWSFSLDTTAENNENNQYLFIRAVATDAALNESDPYDYVVYVNQDTDRPVIKYTNLTNVGTDAVPVYILKFGDNAKLEGSVKDDDETSESIVDTFIASKDKLESLPTSGSNGWTYDSTKGEWQHTYTVGETRYTEKTTFNKSTGEYSYIPGDVSDGTKNVYFYVVDNNNGVFYTGNSTALNKPYQQYKTSAKADNAAAITYNSDSNNPTVQNVLVQAYKADKSANGTAAAPGTSLVLGGTEKKWAKFTINTYDANGIEYITLDLKYTKKSDNTVANIKLASKTGITGFTNSGSADDTSTTSVWTTDFIDISGMKTGTVEGTIMVYDKSGLYGNSFPIFVVDNDGPAITITSPAKTTVDSEEVSEEVSADVSLNGSVTDAGNAGATTIEWITPTATERAKTDTEVINLTTWKDTRADESTVANWKFISSFLAQSKDDTAHEYYLRKTADGVYSIPVYFKSTDALGNVTLKKDFVLTYNPDADKPKTDIAYPSTSDYDNGQNFVTLGGTIRVSGSVNIPSGITSPYGVYIQIADANGNFDNTDKVKAGTGSGNYGYTVVTQSDVAQSITNSGSANLKDNSNNYNLLGFADDTAKSAWWGIQANRSANSWSINLNETGSMNPLNNDSTNNIKIRACAVNQLGKIGTWTDPIEIHIDNNAPNYEGKLFQYSSATEASVSAASGDAVKGAVYYSATPVAELNYKTGMYLKGTWILRVKIEDESDVQMDSNAVKKKIGSALPDNTTYYYHKISKTETSKAEMYVYIPVSESATYSLIARDAEASASGVHIINPGFDINVDNVPPVMTAITNSNDAEIEMTKVSNTNYEFNFKTTAKDTGSGFRMLAYYFRRKTSDTSYSIELPLPPKVVSGNTTYPTYKGNTGNLVNKTNLYGVELSGTSACTAGSGKTTFTASSSFATNNSIRAGAIIELAGSYYTISKIEGTVITVDAEISTAVTSAFVPAAFVIDNPVLEGSQWQNGVQTITNDDGDGIFEYMKITGETASLQTGVCSDQLEDGEIDIVCVAFDQAGNYSDPKTTTIFLQNHAPRLSKVYLATDLNGNGTYSDDEFGTSRVNNASVKYYSALTDGGQVQAAPIIYKTRTGEGTEADPYVYDTGITMRDKLGLAFEFVGNYSYGATGAKNGIEYEGYGAGNSDIYYKLGVSNAAISTATGKASDETLSNKIATMTGKFTGTTGTVASALKGLEIPINTTGLSTYEDIASGCYINISLWDSTPGTTPGIGDTKDAAGKYTAFGSQWTVLNIPLKIDVVDNVNPIASIDAPTVVSGAGHIELPDSLPAANFKDTNSNEYDKDTKVSGRIKFTGKITDEKRVSSIKLKSNKAMNSAFTTDVIVASYDTNTGEIKTTAAATSTTGMSFAIESQSFYVENTTDLDGTTHTAGHEVHWSLEVDTSKVAGIAAADVILTLTASDGTNSHAPTYKMDIVPYITGITRSATTKSTTTMNRSTYGEHPVAIGDTLTVTGFNLPAANTTAAGTTATNSAVVLVGSTKVATTVVSGSAGSSFTIEVPSNSGELVVYNNGIRTLNDKNNNASAGNKDADSKYDNRYIRVWDVGHYFSNSVGGNQPTMATDNAGNLFTTWTLMGTGSVQMQRGLSTVNKPVYVGYDQPDKESALGIDKKSSNGNVANGNMSVLFFPANVGSSGTPDSTCYADAMTIGGVWGVNLYNNVFSATNYRLQYNSKHLQLLNNPYYVLDSNLKSSGYQLAGSSMRREVSQFKNGHTIRFGDNMHFIYYDSYNKSLRYSFQIAGKKISDDNPLETSGNYKLQDDSAKNENQKGTANRKDIVGWVLVDGKSDEQDKVHRWTDNDLELIWGGSGTNGINGTISADGYSFTNNDWGGNFNDCKAIAFAYTDQSGVYKVDLHTITGWNGKIVTWTDHEFPFYYNGETKKYYTPTGVCYYKGDSNVVPNGATQVTNAAEGSYNSIDVTSSGKPVIVYYDSANNTLRIAYSNTATPNMYSATDGAGTFTRQSLSGIVSGGTYVQAKIDGNNYLHIVYRDSFGKMCYIKSTNAPDGAEYTFSGNDVKEIDTAGTYGTLSIIRNGAGTQASPYTYTPCVAFLNSEGTENGIKYSMLKDEGWDTYIVPATLNNYVTGGEYIYVEGKTAWSATDDGVAMADCDAAVGFNTGRMDVVFLKSGTTETTE